MYDFNKMLHQARHGQWLDDTWHTHVKADKLLLIQHLSPIRRPPWRGINKLWVYLGRCTLWVFTHCPHWAHHHYGLKSQQPDDNCLLVGYSQNHGHLIVLLVLLTHLAFGGWRMWVYGVALVSVCPSIHLRSLIPTTTHPLVIFGMWHITIC